MSRPSRVRALALGALLVAAGCQDYNFNPVGHCLISPGSERVTLSDVTTADVLFVVDDSGSMGGEQQKLSDNFKYFIAALNQSNVDRVTKGLEPIDFHLAITTTSVFYNDQAGALCRSDCPGATGNVCCVMTGSTPKQPLTAPQSCSGAGDTSCTAGACRQDCQGWLGDWVCCDAATKSAAENQLVACDTVGEACGNLKTHYLWNPAKPGCEPGHAAFGARYPQGTFVGNPANPLVIHFDKQLYQCATPPCGDTTRNRQGYTASQLMTFFTQNVVAGTCGSGQEQGLQAARLAVQKALDGQQRDTRSATSDAPGDYLADWPHAESKLVLVFVGDEDDCSSPQSASKGVVMNGGDPGADACVADAALPEAQQKEYSVSSVIDYFTGLPGDRPLGAAFIVSATSAASKSYCQDETCVADLCCDTACTKDANVCSSDVCGGQGKGSRFLEAGSELRAKAADVVSGSICDPNFNVILARIAEIVKPPTGLLLPTQPATDKMTLLRIAKVNGKTRKTCKGPAPATDTVGQAKGSEPGDPNAPYDWWFTASREQVTDAQQQPTGPSRYVYINHDTSSCEATPGETYSADYIARMPTNGCFGATAAEADASCLATLGGRAGDWTCFAGTDGQEHDHCIIPTGGAVVGTCICGARYAPPANGDANRAGTGNCPWGCTPDDPDCPLR